MSTAYKEYKILVTRPLPAEAENSQSSCWRATVMDFPSLVEEACSREQVIRQVQARLNELLHQAEIVTLMAPAMPLQNGADDELAAMGYRHYGVFANDPEALRLFDEIEEERNKHLIEPSQT
jgi:hypothetical protein